MYTNCAFFKGQVQPAYEPDPRVEVDGAARGRLPLLQAHAGQCPPCYSSHGNASC